MKIRDLKYVMIDGRIYGIYCPDCNIKITDGISLSAGNWRWRYECKKCGGVFISTEAGQGETATLEQLK